MLTYRYLLAGMTGLALALAVVATASAEGRRHGSSRNGGPNDAEDSSRSQFAAPACNVPHDGHVQFVNNRSPFRGTSRGAYGGIFFAGGGTTVSAGNSSRSTGNSQGVPAAPGSPAAGGRTPAPPATGGREPSGPSRPGLPVVPPDPGASGAGGNGAKVGGAGLVRSAALLYRGVLIQLVNLWGADPTYSHGFLVPPIALFLVWQERDRLRQASLEPSALG